MQKCLIIGGGNTKYFTHLLKLKDKPTETTESEERSMGRLATATYLGVLMNIVCAGVDFAIAGVHTAKVHEFKSLAAPAVVAGFAG